MTDIQIPLPIVITKEDEWFVASCPVLDIATQGKTEEEVKENMRTLMREYFNDPDTPKPDLAALMTTSLTNIPITISEKRLHGKDTTLTSA